MQWKLIVAVLTLETLIASASYTMLLPFLSLFLKEELGVADTELKMWTGMVFSISFLASVLTATYWGKLADRYGTRIMVLRANIGMALVYMLCSIVKSPEQLLIARAIHGVVAGVVPVFLTVCAAVVPVEQLGVSMGFINSAQTAGQVLGPLFGGFLAATLSMRQSFFWAGVMLLAATAAYVYVVPDTKNKGKSKEQVQVSLLRQDFVLQILLAATLAKMLQLLVQSMLSLYVKELTASDIMFWSSVTFAALGGSCALTSPLWGSLGQRIGYSKAFIYSCLSAGAALLLCPLTYDPLSLTLVIFVFGLGFAGMLPLTQVMLSRAIAKEQQGLAFGYNFCFQQIGSTIGPLLGGGLGLLLPMSCVFCGAGACMLLCGGIFFWKLKKA